MASALKIVQKFFPEVTSVKDADEQAHIEVTKRDGSSAAVRNHKACAMAVACKRKFNLDGVIVSVKTAYLVKGKHATRYSMPESVSREVVSFDRNGGFSPGEYRLDAPSPSIRLGKHQGGKSSHVFKKNHKFRHQTDGIRTALGSKTTL